MSDETKPGPDPEEAPEAEAPAGEEAEKDDATEESAPAEDKPKRKAASRSKATKKPKAAEVDRAEEPGPAEAPDEPEAAAPDRSAASETAPTSSEPLAEDADEDTADEAPADEAPADEAPAERPRTEPPPVPPHYRSRHPQPPPPPTGGGGRVVMLIVAVIALVFVILSLANSRSYQIVEEGGQAVLTKGYFLPAGSHSMIPDGAATAFAPIPWITPPQGSVTRGNLREVAGTFYALLYLAAGEAMEDDAAFDQYDQQAAGAEAWYMDRFGTYPEATDKMHDLRYRVRNRRTATKEFLERRDAVLEQIQVLIDSAPEQPSPAVAEDITRFQTFLEQQRAATF